MSCARTSSARSRSAPTSPSTSSSSCSASTAPPTTRRRSQTGLQVVNQTLPENFIRPDESEKAKAELKRKGQHRLIDKVDVRLVASEDKFWAHLANFGDKYVHIPEDVVYKYERLLGGGAWCQLDLLYNADEDEAQKRPFYIRGAQADPGRRVRHGRVPRRPRRSSAATSGSTSSSRSIGLEPSEYDLRGKLLAT